MTDQVTVCGITGDTGFGSKLGGGGGHCQCVLFPLHSLMMYCHHSAPYQSVLMIGFRCLCWASAVFVFVPVISDRPGQRGRGCQTLPPITPPPPSVPWLSSL